MPISTQSSSERKPAHILLATPCYGNMLHTGYFDSVVGLINVCQSLGIGLTIRTLGNESLITRARNFFVNMFISNPAYTHLLFVDSDIGFDARNVVRMLNANRDITVCPYPKKSISWDRVKAAIKEYPEGNDEVIQALSQDYVVNFLTDKAKIEGGFIQVGYGGTGLMLIQRHVIDRLIVDYAYTKYTNDVGGYNQSVINKDNFYTLFDCFICPVSNRYLSEDYAFCDRAIKAGFEIWADLNAHITHTGSHHFFGHYGSHIANVVKHQNASVAPQPKQDDLRHEN